MAIASVVPNESDINRDEISTLDRLSVALNESDIVGANVNAVESVV